MRTVSYAALPGIGPGESPRTATLADLAQEIPYLLVWGVLPPARVLYEILRTSEHDAGMSGGCRWEPIEASSEEHEELAADLGMPVALDTPEWVRGYADWIVWMMEIWRGVPAGEHRRLSREYEEAEAVYREARAQAGEDAPVRGELLERYVKQAEAGRRLSEFVNRYVRSSV